MIPDLEANKAYKSPKLKGGKQAYYKHYKLKGHLEEKCWQKYPKLRPYNAKKDNKPNKARDKQQDTNKGLMLAFTPFELLNLSPKLSNLNLKLEIKPNLSTKLEIKPDLNTKLENLPNLGLATSKPNNKIIIDLSASKHYLPNRDWFSNYTEVANKSIIVANSQRIAIKGISNILIIASDNQELLIINVNYISEIKITLLSLYELTKKG